MTRSRTAVLILAVALLGLVGCQKPTPLVGIVADGTYANTEALVWCFEGQAPGPDETGCARREQETPTLEVQRGDTVGVEVPGEVAERGWLVVVNGESTPLQDETYLSFTVPEFDSAGTAEVQVFAIDPEGTTETEDVRVSGAWLFLLTDADLLGA